MSKIIEWVINDLGEQTQWEHKMYSNTGWRIVSCKGRGGHTAAVDAIKLLLAINLPPLSQFATILRLSNVF